MGHIFKIYFIISILIILTNCTEKTLYSGKILNSSEIEYNNLKDINELTNTLGDPNFIDPIEKKYYYFSEKKKVKNFFNKKIMDRTILVFVFDDNKKIIKFDRFNLNNEQNLKFEKAKTSHNPLNRGLLEKIFGGVGNSVPNTTQ